MIKVDEMTLKKMEQQYPGILETILHFDAAQLPACSHCGSKDTASVQCGIIGRTIYLCSATTKFKLEQNPPTPGQHFCNACGSYFD